MIEYNNTNNGNIDKPLVLMISGNSGVGKDTAALYLAKKYGVGLISFATPIKRILEREFGVTSNEIEQSKNDPDSACRELLVALGKYGRELDPQWWVGKAYSKMKKFIKRLRKNGSSERAIFIITDCRYTNEYLFFSQLLGTNLVLVYMDSTRINAQRGLPKYQSYVEKVEIPKLKNKADYIVLNDGSVEDLYREIEEIFIYSFGGLTNLKSLPAQK